MHRRVETRLKFVRRLRWRQWRWRVANAVDVSVVGMERAYWQSTVGDEPACMLHLHVGRQVGLDAVADCLHLGTALLHPLQPSSSGGGSSLPSGHARLHGGVHPPKCWHAG